MGSDPLSDGSVLLHSAACHLQFLLGHWMSGSVACDAQGPSAARTCSLCVVLHPGGGRESFTQGTLGHVRGQGGLGGGI